MQYAIGIIIYLIIGIIYIGIRESIVKDCNSPNCPNSKVCKILSVFFVVFIIIYDILWLFFSIINWCVNKITCYISRSR